MEDLEGKIGKILESTCGFECPNGAESDKPALQALTKLVEGEKEKAIKDFENWIVWEKRGYTMLNGEVWLNPSQEYLTKLTDSKVGGKK